MKIVDDFGIYNLCLRVSVPAGAFFCQKCERDRRGLFSSKNITFSIYNHCFACERARRGLFSSKNITFSIYNLCFACERARRGLFLPKHRRRGTRTWGLTSGTGGACQASIQKQCRHMAKSHVNGTWSSHVATPHMLDPTACPGS